MKKKDQTGDLAGRRLFLSWLRPFRLPIVLHLLTLVGVTAVLAFVPYFTGKLADQIVAKDVHAALQSILWAGAATVFAQFLWWSFWLRDLRTFERIMPRYIERQGLDCVAAFSLGQCKGENSAFRRTVMLEGQRALLRAVNLIGFDLAPTVIKVLIFSVAIAWTSPVLGALVGVTCGLFVWYSVAVNRRYRPRLEQLERERTRVQKFSSEYTRHIPDAMAAAQERRLNAEVESRTARMHGEEITFWSRHHIRMNLRDLGLIVARFAILAFGVVLATRGRMTLGQFVAVLSWLAIMCDGLGRVGMVTREWVMALVSLGRYARMLAVPPAVTVDPGAAPREIVGRIEFRDVSFRYPEKVSFEEAEEAADEDDGPDEKGEPGDRAVLGGVSFVVEPGETLALVGESGAGKSTIVDLLLRGYDPDRGCISVDGADIRSLNLSDYRQRVGYVPQDITLYDGTLLTNLLFAVGDRPVGEDEMNRVLAISRVADFLPSLGPEGLARRIGERGARLSGGQRQRVGIARALMKNPKVLILDEATSSLDARNEGAFYEAVFEDERLAGITRIVIAHRLGTIRRADKIVFLEKGKVVDIGSHRELVERCASYRALVLEQAYTVVLGPDGEVVAEGYGNRGLRAALSAAPEAVLAV